MAIKEQETTIRFNDAEMRDGYFVFGTSQAGEWAKLCKRIGGEANLLEVGKSVVGGRVAYYTAKVPLKYLKGYWGIGNGRKRVLDYQDISARRVIIEAARKALAAKRSK